MKAALKQAVVTSCLLLGPGVCHALQPSEVFDKVAPSVWVVRAFDGEDRPLGLGSGVVTAPGKVITNCHVLAKAKAVVVRKKNVLYGATLEHADPERDLCLLSVENFSAPAVEIAKAESLKVGQKVYAIGNPQGLELTLSEGLISALRAKWLEGGEVLQTTAPISPGSSGGGLFDEQGRLVGITSSGLVGGGAQNLNFAMPAYWIAEVPARAEAALAKRKQGQGGKTLASAAPSAPPGYPAPGTVWVYRMTERSNHNRISQITVRADSVDKDFVEETLVLLGGTVAPARRTVGTHDARFESYSLGRDSIFLEFSPYLLASTGGKQPDPVVSVNGYPVKDVVRPGNSTSYWIIKTVPHEWEEVDVPAGRYRALHYELLGKKDRQPVSGMSLFFTEFKLNVWYAPEIRRIVKLEHQLWTSNPVPYADDEVELMEYRPPR